MLNKITHLLTKKNLLKKSETIRFLKMPSKPNKNTFIPVLIFRGKSKTPSFIAKIFKNPYEQSCFNRIIKNQLKIRSKLNGSSIADSLPKVFLYDFTSSFFVESFVTGTNLVPIFLRSVKIQSKNFKAIIKLLKEWVIYFHMLTFNGNSKASDVDFYFKPDEIESLQEIFKKDYQLIFDYFLKCQNYNFKVPTSYCHGDFNSYNIKIERDRIKVYDWEDLCEREVPIFDIFHLFTVPVIFNRTSPENYVDSFKKYIISSSRYKDLFVHFLAEYCYKFCLEWKYVNWYYLVYLLKMCLKERNISRRDEKNEEIWCEIAVKYIEMAGGIII